MSANRSWLCALAGVLLMAACADEPPTGPPITAARTPGLPPGWLGSGGSSQFEVGLDRTNKRAGAAAAYIRARIPAPEGFATITQGLRADRYRGNRVRWSGWVRHDGVNGDGAGLWMRIDGPGVTLAFDNMSNRSIQGSRDWHFESVVLDVPMNAIGIALGVLLSGGGDLLIDDLRLEVVGSNVPATNQFTQPVPSGVDSASVTATYERRNHEPVNLDFEGLVDSPPPAATIDWLNRTAVPFVYSGPQASDADLEPLRQMVGSARIVALGEGTHGTRDFFLLKHRVFQFLVRQMGFTHFAIEATWPEANDLNNYVLTCIGDRRRLLSNLYFWTWNTGEVLALIAWMCEWNLTAAPDRKVQFLGFDMQYPGAAMDTVTAFVARVDAASASVVSTGYACLAPYRNDGPVFRQPASAYAALPAATRSACRDALQSVHTLLRTRQAAYQQASSAAAYQNALQSARLVQQYEEMAGLNASPTLGSQARDRFMAENTQWLLNQAPPGTRMMLWAHNYHVSRLRGAMGDHLAQALGADFINLGFLFGRGSFNAVGSGGLRSWNAQLVPNSSLEAFFVGTGQARLLFDTRRIASGGTVAQPLAGPITMRSIGAGFDPSLEANYFATYLFPNDFDLLMYVAETSASTLLPFLR